MVYNEEDAEVKKVVEESTNQLKNTRINYQNILLKMALLI